MLSNNVNNTNWLNIGLQLNSQVQESDKYEESFKSPVLTIGSVDS
jgi:hypothetical protein